MSAPGEIKADDNVQIEHVDGRPGDIEAGEILKHEVLETKYAQLSRWQTAKIFWKPVLICIACSWAALNDGFQVQIPGNIIANVGFIQEMADTVVDGVPTISAKHISLWGGVGCVFQVIGQATGGTTSDFIGRKPTLALFTIVFLSSSVLSILSNNWKMWLGAKILGQFAVGMATSTILTYVSEMTPFQIRGTVCGSYQLFLALGQLLGSIATQIVNSTTPYQWRRAIISEFVFTGIFCVIIPFLPESHMYYARKGKVEKAKKVMKKVYGYVEGYDLEHEYAVIEHGIEEERMFQAASSQSSWSELFRGTNGRRTLAGTLGICAQPFFGTGIFFNYSTYFFASAGLHQPFLITVIVYLLLLVFVSIGMTLCELVGRRPILLGGCAAMIMFNIGLGTTGVFNTSGSDKAALAFIILWVMAYGTSAAPIGFVSASEMSTPRLRGKTTSLNLAIYAGGNLIFQWTVPYLISPTAADLGVKTAYMYVGLAIPVIVLLFFFYPETTGRTFLELDELFERGIPARKFKQTATRAETQGLKTALKTHV